MEYSMERQAFNGEIAAPDLELLTAQEVARLLKTHASTIYRLAQSGELRSKKIGKLIRFRPADVKEYIQTA